MTVIVSEPATLSTVARICTEPGAADRTTPLVDTLAMVGSDETHWAVVVWSTVVPSERRTDA